MIADMQFQHEVTYDATAAEVFAMLADPAFRQRSARVAMDARNVEVQITPAAAGEGMKVVVDQEQPTSGVPGFAKKFIGETTRAVQTEEWSSARNATITIDTPGRPFSLHGTLLLTESGNRTTETMQAEIKVRVPLIGGRLEKLMADMVSAGMDKEHTAGVAWLKGER